MIMTTREEYEALLARYAAEKVEWNAWYQREGAKYSTPTGSSSEIRGLLSHLRSEMGRLDMLEAQAREGQAALAAAEEKAKVENLWVTAIREGAKEGQGITVEQIADVSKSEYDISKITAWLSNNLTIVIIAVFAVIVIPQLLLSRRG